VTTEKLTQVTRLNALATVRGQTLAQMALAWVLRHPSMTSVLVGASSVAQIEENIKACDNLSFSAEELKSIETILAPA